MSVGFKTYFWPESTRNQVVTACKQKSAPGTAKLRLEPENSRIHIQKAAPDQSTRA